MMLRTLLPCIVCLGLALSPPRATRRGATTRATRTRAAAVVNSIGIVGSGPAGLSLAIAIERALPDVDVTIFDRSDACRPGAGDQTAQFKM